MALIKETPGQVTFGQAIIDFFRGYGDFKGRSTRAGYWWMALVDVALAVVAFVWLISSLKSNNETQAITGLIVTVVVSLISLALALPHLTLAVRRYRDAGLTNRGLTLLIVTSGVVSFLFSYVPGFKTNGVMAFLLLIMTVISFVVSTARSDYFLTTRTSAFVRFFFRAQE